MTADAWFGAIADACAEHGVSTVRELPESALQSLTDSEDADDHSG